MEFRIFGHLEVVTKGRSLRLGGPCEQKTLAILLLDVGRIVPLSRLVDTLWDEDPPATAAKQARNAVSRVRRVLRDGDAANLIETIAAGYRLAVTGGELDALVFETLVGQAGQASSAGQVASAAETLASALDLWRGPCLDGLGGQRISAAAAAWDERRCVVTETYYDHQLALGRHHDVLGPLTAFVADHPLRERPVSQLMVAFSRCGRQADALALYRATRIRLADELGLDPGGALRGLHQRILTADPALAGPQGTDGEQPHAAGRDSPVIPRQLPAAIRNFTGRRAELSALTELLPGIGQEGGSIVSVICGTAGVGKTALAVHWAHQVAAKFPDGQLHVDLRGFGPAAASLDAGEALRGLLDALGVAPERLPASLESQAALYRSLLSGKRMLVVLDNARDVSHVRPLLPSSPGCLVLVTSRSQLTGLIVTQGACPLVLDVLAEDEAFELLTSRAGATRLDAEPAAAAELVALCAGLPLALSIVAARAAVRPGLAFSALASELRDTRGVLDSLETGDAVTDVRMTFSWSYRQLSPPAARMFRMLGLHPGPDISVPAAASLAAVPTAESRRLLGELAAANLLSEHVHGRFSFHDLLRAYAAEQALACDERSERRSAIHRMLDHYLQAGHAATRLLNPARDAIELASPVADVVPEDLAGPGRPFTWFETEHHVVLGVIRCAVANGFDRYGWQLPWVLATFLDRRGHWEDLAASQRTALAAAEGVGDQVGQAYAHRLLGRAFVRLCRYDDASVHLQQARSLFGQLGHKEGEANVHLLLALISERRGHFDEALSHAKESLRLFTATGHQTAQGTAENAVGWYYACLGNGQMALVYCRRALRSHRDARNRDGEAAAWDSIGYSLGTLGDHARATACFQRAVALHRESGARHSQASALRHLGEALLSAGDYPGARGAWQEALDILDGLRHPDADQVRAKLNDPDGQVPAGLVQSDAD